MTDKECSPSVSSDQMKHLREAVPAVMVSDQSEEGSDMGDVPDVRGCHSDDDVLTEIARHLVSHVLSQSLAEMQADQVGEVWTLCS